MNWHGQRADTQWRGAALGGDGPPTQRSKRWRTNSFAQREEYLRKSNTARSCTYPPQILSPPPLHTCFDTSFKML